jgi:hypothetical protein
MAREIEYRPGHYYPKGTFTESEVRDIVGAPTREEEELCVCGDRIEDCKQGYEHMTHGC